METKLKERQLIGKWFGIHGQSATRELVNQSAMGRHFGNFPNRIIGVYNDFLKDSLEMGGFAYEILERTLAKTNGYCFYEKIISRVWVFLYNHDSINEIPEEEATRIIKMYIKMELFLLLEKTLNTKKNNKLFWDYKNINGNKYRISKILGEEKQ